MKQVAQSHGWSRGVGMITLLAATSFAFGQASGFNLTIGFGPSLLMSPSSQGFTGTSVGFAFQQDFEPRFGMALDLSVSGDGYDDLAVGGIVSAKYFATDNDVTAMYIGSFFGVRSMRAGVTEYSGAVGQQVSTHAEYSKLQFPIGLRGGVRGGLGGYFGELFAQAGYVIGNGTLYVGEGTTVKSSPLYLTLGFSFIGFGWEHG